MGLFRLRSVGRHGGCRVMESCVTNTSSNSVAVPSVKEAQKNHQEKLERNPQRKKNFPEKEELDHRSLFPVGKKVKYCNSDFSIALEIKLVPFF